ncbi:glutathione S-transferase [Trichoderma citrinoviride]|uniref:Glutathione S-transferase n=1 Tax=Trichoderma citrinoviride TaxID=58853 RepID=A0A2T4BFL8_9HYPO|nr:glutathione S-transferase [Trichoderma citrinoviride]PTB68041.1 glutathione S-transferase [Trichoderma citrinoviride]
MEHPLQLLTENTTNGKKVQILLEELQDIYGISWATHLIDLETDEQKKRWFLRLNPNGRIPVLLDVAEDGSVISIFESSAILTYLQEHHDPRNVFGFGSASERSQALQWLFFWHSSGPVQGHTRHFVEGVPEPAPYAARYFQAAMLRIYSVLEAHLSGQHSGHSRQYLAGHGRGKYSIADMGTWPHVRAYLSLGFSEEGDMRPRFPHLLQWIDRIAARPPVQRGVDAGKYDSEENPGLRVRAE